MDDVHYFSHQDTKHLLEEEYPEISSWDINIEKQFEAGPGRLFNAFLISCKSPSASHSQFVAKAAPPHANDSDGIRTEWHSLQLVQAGSFSLPKLLFPSHQPQHFLILELIPGVDAHTAIAQGADINRIISLIATCTRKLHQVPAPQFGELEKEPEDWKVYMERKIRENLKGTKHLINQDLHRSATQLVNKTLPFLQYESTAPILIHRDIYRSNFIINAEQSDAAIIDFGMARGGKPLYDLAKFYILDLYDFPEARHTFYNSYFAKDIPEYYQELMTVYMLRELLGMIGFFNVVKQPQPLQRTIKVLEDLVANKGTIRDLLLLQ